MGNALSMSLFKSFLLLTSKRFGEFFCKVSYFYSNDNEISSKIYILSPIT